jgi:serine/threonine-protein kinase
VSAAQVRAAARRRQRLGLGSEVGGYRLGPLIGRGGMGDIYRATHRLLGRPAAVKLIRPEVLIEADDDDVFLTLRRFRREATAGAKLHSPHAVKLFDFGVADGGTFYIAMELLEGIDLARFVARFGPMPAERAVHVLHQVSAALREMHERGLVHRDIKPENLHLMRRGEHHDFIKVTDLGLVKPERGATAEHRLVRARGHVVGTPAFMAPETSKGDPGDERTDIYALGCVAYWLLTGCTLFDACNAQELMRSHIGREPMPPSQRTELELPPSLERLVLWCLAKHPEMRPQTAEEFSRRLAACSLPRVWTEALAERWWTTHLPSGEVAMAAESEERLA